MKKLLIITCYLLLVTFVTPALAWAATLSLSPATGAFNKGCQFDVKIELDTGGQDTDGTDAIILYDTSRLTATAPTSGTIYPDYPGTNVDDQAGKITISGLASVTTAFKDVGTLATLHFSVKASAATGATLVRFDFEPGGKTTDSNVVQRGTVQDILSSVTNGNYTIGTGACAQASPSPSPATPPVITGGQGTVVVASPPAEQIPVKEVPVKTLPPAGSEQFSYMIVILGSALTVLGILGLALL